MEWINILWVMLGIGLMLVLNIRYQINSMVALLLAALLVGTLAGMDLLKLLHTIKAGFGGTLGELAIIVVFGAVIGKLMVDSGAAHQIAQTLLRRFGLKYVEAAVIIIGLIFGLAMFYELPLLFWHHWSLLLRSKPRYRSSNWRSGSCCSDDGSLPIPTTAGAGCAGCRLWRRHGDGLYLWSSGCYSFSDLCRAYFAKVLGQSGQPIPTFLKSDNPIDENNLPSFSTSILVPLIPAFIMIFTTIANIWLVKGTTSYTILNFIGSSPIAMFIAMLVAFVLFGTGRGHKMEWVMHSFEGAVKALPWSS